MALKDTYQTIASWPREIGLPYFEAALQDPHFEVQSAGYTYLTDPGLLNRPDLVILHFESLLPEIKQRIVEQKGFFIEIARKQIRTGTDFARKAAYKMLGEVGGPDAAQELAMGVDDASTLIRFNIAESLEKIAMNYHYHLLNWEVRKDPKSREFIGRNRKAMLDGLPDLLKTWPFHRKDIFIKVAIESGADAYKVITGIILNMVDGPVWKAFIETMQASHSEAMCEVLFKLYLEGPGKYRDCAVDIMKRRRDAEFPMAVSRFLSTQPAERLYQLRSMKEIPFWPAVEANPNLPGAVVIPLVEFVANALLPQKDRDMAIKGLLKNSNAVVRIHVLNTFRQLNIPHIGEIARESLDDPDDDVKLVAARLVSELMPVNKARLLAPLLDSPNEELRRTVMKEVADFNVARYATAFANPDPAARQLAERVASRIDEPTVAKVVEELIQLDPVHRLQALRLAEPASMDRELRPLLTELLTDPNGTLRPLIVQIMAFSGNRRGLRVLLEMLGSGDLSVSTRIIEAFQEMHDMRFAALFLPFIVDRETAVKAAAGRTVATFGMAEAQLLLTPLVTVGDDRLRMAAIQAIAQMKVEGGRELLSNRMRVETNAEIRDAILDLVNNWD